MFFKEYIKGLMERLKAEEEKERDYGGKEKGVGRKKRKKKGG